MSNQRWDVLQGAPLALTVVLEDEATGEPLLNTYEGTEELLCQLWPGGSRPAVATGTATWIVADDATISVLVPGTATADLDQGQYKLLVQLQDGDEWVPCYQADVDIQPAPGTEAEPPSYISYHDLLQHGRAWLPALQTQYDETGFAHARGRARTWVEDLGHAHYRWGGGGGSDARYRYYRSAARSPELTGWFADDLLVVTDAVREACVLKTLAYVCEGQIGPGEAGQQFAALARHYHTRADQLGSTLVLEFAAPAEGVFIHCGTVDSIRG